MGDGGPLLAFRQWEKGHRCWLPIKPGGRRNHHRGSRAATDVEVDRLVLSH